MCLNEEDCFSEFLFFGLSFLLVDGVGEFWFMFVLVFCFFFLLLGIVRGRMNLVRFLDSEVIYVSVRL